MSMTRVLLKCFGCLCVLALGLVLLTKPIGRVLPHGQFVPIKIQTTSVGSSRLYLLDMERSIVGQIASPLSQFSEISMSSDGAHIALSFLPQTQDNCKLSIYSLLDGTIEYFPLSKICGPPIAPQWSPDNRFIVYNTSLTGDLYILSLQSEEVQQVYHDLNNNRNAVWSPDGKLLAFSLVPPSTSSSSNSSGIMPPKSLEFIRMNCGADCQPVSNLFATLPYPVIRSSWSPDQSRMAFLSTGYGLGVKLYVWDTSCLTEKVPDCTLQKDQLRELILRKVVIFDDIEPIWSPDGRSLMFDATINRHTGFYRVPSDCYDDADGCKPELILDFDKIMQARMQ